jgi:hypothetical protein
MELRVNKGWEPWPDQTRPVQFLCEPQLVSSCLSKEGFSSVLWCQIYIFINMSAWPRFMALLFISWSLSKHDASPEGSSGAGGQPIVAGPQGWGEAAHCARPQGGVGGSTSSTARAEWPWLGMIGFKKHLRETLSCKWLPRRRQGVGILPNGE